MASKTKRPAPPPPPKNFSIPAKPPPPQRPSPQSSPSKPRPPPKVVNGAMQNQQMQTQKPATDSHQANSPVKSSTDMQSAQTNSSRVPPQPTASGRIQAQRAVSPPREPPPPPDGRLSSARNSGGSVVQRQQPTCNAAMPSQSSRTSHKPLSPASSSTGSIASQDQLMMKYKTVERNYEQLKSVARKGKSEWGRGL